MDQCVMTEFAEINAFVQQGIGCGKLFKLLNSSVCTNYKGQLIMICSHVSLLEIQAVF